jgi:hypothetical protein
MFCILGKVKLGVVLSMGILVFSCSPPTDRANPYDPRAQNHDSNLLPVVRSVFPPVGESNASLLSAVYAEFNIPIDPGTVSSRSFMLLDNQGRPIDGKVSCSGVRLAYTPDALLEPGATYTVLLANRLCATNGLPMTNSYSWSFKATTNMAGIYPVVVSHAPGRNETNVSRNSEITVNFSESMDGVSINAQTFSVTKHTGAAVKGSISTSGSVARFLPDGLLDYGTTNTVRLTKSVRNACGRELQAVFSESFVTEPLVLNMTNWIKVADPANHPALDAHALVVFQDKLWIILGYIGGFSSNMYHTSDGINWVPHLTTFNLQFPDAYVYNDQIFFTHGGYDNVWSSPDGDNWSLETSTAGFSGRMYCRIVFFNGAFWFVGGGPSGWSGNTDVWYSYNGATWIQATANGGFFPRCAHGMAVFKDQLWFMGGKHELNRYNDVWHSKDGTNWELATPSAAFSARFLFEAISYNEKLYILGGESPTGLCSDIWCTEDGTNWTLAMSIAPWGQRRCHRVAIWKNKLWLIGGTGVSGRKNDIWCSD